MYFIILTSPNIMYIRVAYNISTVHAIRNMSRVDEYLRVSFSQD